MTDSRAASSSRANRSSTLPSVPALADLTKISHFPHRSHDASSSSRHPHHHHHHHSSHSHRSSETPPARHRPHRSHQLPRPTADPLSAALSATAATAGEFLQPVRNVAGGLAGLAPGRGGASSGERNRSKSRDRRSGGGVREPDGARKRGKTGSDVQRARAQRRALESALTRRYEAVAGALPAVHAALVRSREGLRAALAAQGDALGSLRALARDARELKRRFVEESAPAVTEEYEGQVRAAEAALARVEGERVLGLEARLRVAGERVEEVSKRLEGVGTSVDAWQEREGEGRWWVMLGHALRRGWGRRGWAVLGIVVGMLLLLALATTLTGGEKSKRAVAEETVAEAMGNVSAGSVGPENRDAVGRGPSVDPEASKLDLRDRRPAGWSAGEEPESDDLLDRIFDDL